MVPLQRLEVGNILQRLSEKVVQTIAEPCSQTLEIYFLLPFEANPL